MAQQNSRSRGQRALMYGGHRDRGRGAEHRDCYSSQASKIRLRSRTRAKPGQDPLCLRLPAAANAANPGTPTPRSLAAGRPEFSIFVLAPDPFARSGSTSHTSTPRRVGIRGTPRRAVHRLPSQICYVFSIPSILRSSAPQPVSHQRPIYDARRAVPRV